MGLSLLPEDKWGTVVGNYTQLYGNVQDYTTGLKVLEQARTDKPDSPGLRVMLGYHYGYLGYPQQAVAQLDTAIGLEKRDPFAAKLRNQFAAKVGLAPIPVPVPPQEQGPVVPAQAPPPAQGTN